jgi:hypothetical protein
MLRAAIGGSNHALVDALLDHLVDGSKVPFAFARPVDVTLNKVGP